MAGPTLTIEAPKRDLRLGGIMQVAEVREDSRVGIGQGVVFQSDGCEFPNTEELRCFAESQVPDKTYDPISIDDAIDAPFVIYAGVQCYLSSDIAEYETRARAQLTAGQDRVLEDALETYAAGGAALTAGATATEAVGRVDQELDDKYIGRGIILMSRYDAIVASAAGAIKVEADGMIKTATGTPVVASGRVAPGVVYGLGSVVVVHSPVVSYPATDHTSNKHYALAEATYVLAVDCEFRVKSTITA